MHRISTFPSIVLLALLSACAKHGPDIVASFASAGSPGAANAQADASATDSSSTGVAPPPQDQPAADSGDASVAAPPTAATAASGGAGAAVRAVPPQGVAGSSSGGAGAGVPAAGSGGRGALASVVAGAGSGGGGAGGVLAAVTGGQVALGSAGASGILSIPGISVPSDFTLPPRCTKQADCTSSVINILALTPNCDVASATCVYCAVKAQHDALAARIIACLSAKILSGCNTDACLLECRSSCQ